MDQLRDLAKRTAADLRLWHRANGLPPARALVGKDIDYVTGCLYGSLGYIDQALQQQFIVYVDTYLKEDTRVDKKL